MGKGRGVEVRYVLQPVLFFFIAPLFREASTPFHPLPFMLLVSASFSMFYYF